MDEFLYTTWTRRDNEWVREMLDTWKRSKKPYLAFPWILFNVKKLSRPPFWLYLYYAHKHTDIDELAGAIEYRLRIIDWKYMKFYNNNIYLHRGDEDGKVWFLCDQFQEVRKTEDVFVRLKDFRHYHGKNLPSTMRNSIPQVVCDIGVKVISHFP
jgi:hypothetical protein